MYPLTTPLALALALALAAPPSARAGEVESRAAAALAAYRAGSLETALEGLEAATLALSRELSARAVAEPLRITAARFLRHASDTDEALVDAPALAERPGEFFLRVEISGLDREERRGRFRHHLRHTVTVVGPDGRTLLEETPVDRRSDFGPYVTSLHVTDRLPVPPEWPAGNYKARLVVEDGLAADPAKTRVTRELPFEVKPVSPAER